MQGHTAYMLACDQGQLAAMRMLLAHGAHYNVHDNQVIRPLLPSISSAVKCRQVLSSAVKCCQVQSSAVKCSHASTLPQSFVQMFVSAQSVRAGIFVRPRFGKAAWA